MQWFEWCMCIPLVLENIQTQFTSRTTTRVHSQIYCCASKTDVHIACVTQAILDGPACALHIAYAILSTCLSNIIMQTSQCLRNGLICTQIHECHLRALHNEANIFCSWLVDECFHILLPLIGKRWCTAQRGQKIVTANLKKMSKLIKPWSLRWNQQIKKKDTMYEGCKTHDTANRDTTTCMEPCTKQSTRLANQSKKRSVMGCDSQGLRIGDMVASLTSTSPM